MTSVAKHLLTARSAFARMDEIVVRDRSRLEIRDNIGSDAIH
jgi:hypothetical protein